MDNEKIVEAVSDKMDVAMVEIAEALKGAVDQYGADAVDLALVAFRVEAAQQIVAGLTAVAVAVICWKLLRWLWDSTQDGWDDADNGAQIARIFGTIAGVMFGGLMLAAGILRVTSISAWIAVFGYPELRIAMKALEAAGLM